MTAESAREMLPGEGPARHGRSPLVTVRVFQIALWILVVSGPVAALLVATRVSLIRSGLEVVSSRAGMELPPDTTGAEGFAELFIATYLGAGEASADALGPFLGDPSLDGVENRIMVGHEDDESRSRGSWARLLRRFDRCGSCRRRS